MHKGITVYLPVGSSKSAQTFGIYNHKTKKPTAMGKISWTEKYIELNQYATAEMHNTKILYISYYIQVYISEYCRMVWDNVKPSFVEQ